MGVAAFLASAALLLAGAQARTTLHVFTPWAGSIPARGVTIASTVRGACSRGSERLRRFDVWRCAAGGQVYDPCFANTRAGIGAHVLCLASPWEAATALELAAPLPLARANPDSDPMRSRPWAMLTARDERCALAPAPLGRIAGLPVTYVCAGSALLLGQPARGPAWTQAEVATSTARTSRRVALLAVWW